MSTTGSRDPRSGEVLTLALRGLDAHVTPVVARAEKGPADLRLLGLAEGQARESRVRVRATLQQIGIDLNEDAITVDLGPADRPKSAGFDLPIAVAVLGALGHVSLESLKNTVLLGELSLTGVLRPVRGVLPALRGAIAEGHTRAIVPKANAREAAAVPGLRVFVVEHLPELMQHLREGTPIASAGEPPTFPIVSASSADMADIRGMHGARRVLEIAAAGGHHLLLLGQVGSGKTLLARRLPGILPPLTFDEALEITAIHSVSGLLPVDAGLIGTRPFRAPHHTVSVAGLGGGGDPVRPGEVSLAHHGVLFLDQLLEFRDSVVDVLRQPLDEGRIAIHRALSRTVLPARPLVVGATNPCPCGFIGHKVHRCTCFPDRLVRYRERLNASPFDRFDLRIVVPPADVTALRGTETGEPSREVQKRVVAARVLQAERLKEGASARTNGQLSARDLERFATPDAAGARTLQEATERLGLTAASYGRLLRVSRTLADLDGSDAVRAPHVAEAIHATQLPKPTQQTPG